MKRNKHSLSNYKLATMKMGGLYPVGMQHVLPGDTFQHQTSALLRMSPLVAPVMHPVQVRIHHWYVPYRLLDADWEDFITQADPLTQPMAHTCTPTNTAKGKLADYFGIPPVTSNLDVLKFPFAAYAMIYNEYYRDQDLQPTEIADDNEDVLNVSWSKDMFTTARPWTQKGPEVTIPLGEKAYVKAENYSGTVQGANVGYLADSGDSKVGISNGSPNPYYADLSAATGANINDVRKAFALQRYQEARARYGSRYTEYLRYLGINPSDARLQRPEYLGGGKQTISFSEVLQTAEGTNPVGTMAGHGISAMRSNRYRRFFEEHGIVLTLMSVVPKNMYMDGVSRNLTKWSHTDFYQKELEHIGMQEVLSSELYAKEGNVATNTIFGYNDRYYEYRHQPSTVAGDFRDTMNHWHLARSFAQRPVLNESFIKCEPSNRIFADQTGNDTLWVMVNHNVKARRMVKRNASARVI